MQRRNIFKAFVVLLALPFVPKVEQKEYHFNAEIIKKRMEDFGVIRVPPGIYKIMLSSPYCSFDGR